MEKVSQEWLECPCESCNRQIRFKPSDAQSLALCPFCHKQTLLRVIATPREVGLPSWLLPVSSLLAIILLLAAGMYEFHTYPVRQMGVAEAFPVIFLFDFLLAAIGVSWVLFLVYVFISLREMRKTLKEIEVNTRAPQLPPSPPEPLNPPGSPSPSSPLTPPRADAKYMPKG